MTNVDEPNPWKEMIIFKQIQAESNSHEILEALDELKIPSSPAQIRDYMETKAKENATREANEKYESGEITRTDRDRYIKKFGKTMSLRTIQRWLARYTACGYVAYSYNGYYLLSKGKREIQFRKFSRSYGTMALNSLFDLLFPTLSNDEVNLQKLINIFGVYVVYCLMEAARLVTANKNNDEEHWKSSYFDPQADFDRSGRFRERNLIKSWIMHTFNPMNMLNLFLATIVNSSDSEKQMDHEETMLNYINFLEQTGMNTFKKSIKGVNLNTKGSTFPPSTLDLIFKHVESSSYRNQYEPADYWKQKQFLYPFLIQSGEDTILYEVDNEKLAFLKNIMKQKYPLFCRQLECVDKYFYSKDASR